MQVKAKVGKHAPKYKTALQREGEVRCFVVVVLR